MTKGDQMLRRKAQTMKEGTREVKVMDGQTRPVATDGQSHGIAI